MAESVTKKSRRGTETRQKQHLVTSRYSAEEYAELETAASRAGLTRASYQRVQSLTTTKTRSTRRPPIEREITARLLGQLGRVGGNVYQLVRAVNFGATEIERDELRGLMRDMGELRGVVMQALGRKP